MTSIHDRLRAAIDASRVRWDLEALMLRMLAGNPNAIVDERRGGVPLRRPTGLTGVAAALLVEQAAHGLAREHAGRARGAGHSWEEIAEAAGLEPQAEPWERAIEAFRLAAGTPVQVWDEQIVWWRCDSCGQRIRDAGPEAGRGDDERGHAPSCQRRLTQLAAWQAQDGAVDWDDDVDDDRDADEDLDDGWDDEDWHDDAGLFASGAGDADAPARLP